MKSLVILIVAVLLSATSSAAATRLITSKDIKDGTIRPVDMSLAAKRLNKLHKVTIRNYVAFSYASTGPKTVTALCPPGTVVVGGGFTASADGPPARILVSESAPAQNAEGWRATGEYVNPNLLAALYVYAICA